MYYDEDQERREDKRNKILRTPINDFELSVRSRNCLAKMGVHTLGDLVKKTEPELLSYKNFGETSLQEIKADPRRTRDCQPRHGPGRPDRRFDRRDGRGTVPRPARRMATREVLGPQQPGPGCVAR